MTKASWPIRHAGRDLSSTISCLSRVNSAKRPMTLSRRSESSTTERKFDSTAAIETIEKLRYILHQLNSGQLPLEDLKRNIEYAALVLETAYMDETRRICDEDDDLAEVTPETVPDEVREWLAATFTRQSGSKKREKPKFKSVANAIRTGIFFDKLFRKQQNVQCPIPPEIAELLREINSWSFNPFLVNEVSEGHVLKYVGFELFNKYGFMDRFKIPLPAFENFLHALEQGYSKHNNPYHNVVHAADVTQSSHFMLSQTGLANSLGDLELLAVLFGALIHDYEHTGHTNNFHIQSGELRNMVIEIVLATDMSTHFVQIKTMKNMLSLPEGIDKNKALCLIVHACDISHPSKPWLLHQRWTEGVLEEFFRQGDLEASMGLPYSPLCDRHTVLVADSQIEHVHIVADFIMFPAVICPAVVLPSRAHMKHSPFLPRLNECEAIFFSRIRFPGFIDFIVEPTMVVCGELLTKMVEPLVSLPPVRFAISSKRRQ
ncbi:3',5'-cyclic-nucleotide phosphodiesterase pde1 [Parelaphostrongylus tenuis]|uniref:Phosphodiesterase n=1 Tax=Parelaphostrongylus tenuis TaxID=148309 RepID=A0AAD5R0F0_PARTN|nr:3',5'-cyclic-nucleotide phosphodiesterase pde1 [Parelaphostrongylus tenuis]